MLASALKRDLRFLFQAALAIGGVSFVAVAVRGYVLNSRVAHRAGGDVATSIPAAIVDRVELHAREQPLTVERTPGLEEMVTDEQAFLALSASLPRWHPPMVAQLLHELRLWGPTAAFSDERFPKVAVYSVPG